MKSFLQRCRLTAHEGGTLDEEKAVFYNWENEYYGLKFNEHETT